MLRVPEFIDYYTGIWDNCPVSVPHFDRSYSPSEQAAREEKMMQFQEELKKLQAESKIRSVRNGEQDPSFFPLFRNFLKNVFDFEEDQLKIILSEQFKDVSRDFFYRARAFAPELSMENIYQGMRNVWIMNGLQQMLGVPVEITPSVFGYSMIYPYSDNFLDDCTVSEQEKRVFSDQFNRRLHGEKVISANFTEAQLFRLVGMFEKQYPRTNYPDVYASLYAIQKGQTDSLRLMRASGLSPDNIQRICFEKGGASVLADGYVVAGKLTPSQEQALFGYGIYLQLLDDIQDIQEDTNARTRTLFSCFDGPSNLDKMVNRSIHFGRVVLEEMRCLGGAQMDLMIRLMNHSIEMMIIESAGLNASYYPPETIRIFEKHSPLRFAFLRENKSRAKSQRFLLFQKYFRKKPAGKRFYSSEKQ